jgi:hypothetical protein
MIEAGGDNAVSSQDAHDSGAVRRRRADLCQRELPVHEAGLVDFDELRTDHRPMARPGYLESRACRTTTLRD